MAKLCVTPNVARLRCVASHIHGAKTRSLSAAGAVAVALLPCAAALVSPSAAACLLCASM